MDKSFRNPQVINEQMADKAKKFADHYLSDYCVRNPDVSAEYIKSLGGEYLAYVLSGEESPAKLEELNTKLNQQDKLIGDGIKVNVNKALDEAIANKTPAWLKHTKKPDPLHSRDNQPKGPERDITKVRTH